MVINLKKIRITFFITFLVIIIAFSIYLQDSSAIKTIKIIVNANKEVSQGVNLYCYDDDYYVFLPSYTDVSNMHITSQSGYSIFIDGDYYSKNSLLNDIVIGKKHTLEIKNVLGITIHRSKMIFLKGNNIATLSISLKDGTLNDINESKEISKSGYLSLTNPDGKNNYLGEIKKIHGRGNTTWTQNKKPYTIEFSEDVNLLGMGASKKYCLLANACDESNLRNKIAFDAAKECGLKYTVDSEFVDFYVDGEYCGLYLLTESIDLGKNRINITDMESKTRASNLKSLKNYNIVLNEESGVISKSWDIPNSPNDITGGYILEIDEKSRINSEDSYFIFQDDIPFALKNPKYATESQIKYISGFMQSIVTDLEQGKINSNIDIKSWLYYYLIQECFANHDIWSIYFVKDSDFVDNKIYAGPIWDFDFSMGTLFLGKDANPMAFYANTHGVYNKLYQIDEFQQQVKLAYKNKFRTLMIKYSQNILEEYKNTMEDSYKMNHIRWKSIQEYEWCNHYDNFQEHIDYLSNFLEKRIDFLDKAWIDNKEICRIYFKSDGPALYEKHYYSVEYGKTVGKIPNPVCEGYKFLGYYSNDTGAIYNPDEPVTNNVNYIAKWEKLDGENTDNSKVLSIQERILLKLNDETLYLKIGVFLLCFAVVAFILFDLYQHIKTRRIK